jgi:hypothetical protein
LAELAISVVEVEYPTIRQWKWETPHEPNVATQRKMEKLWADIRKITPKTPHEQAIFSEVLKCVNALGQARQERIVISRSDLPDVIWITVILGGLITIGFMALFGSENVKGQIVITALLGIVLSLVIFVVISLNFPFTGMVSIQPDGYERVINLTGWDKKIEHTHVAE